MITVTDKQIDDILTKLTTDKNGKSYVYHLPDGTIIYGKLSKEEKKNAYKQAKKNLKIMVGNLSKEINKHIVDRIMNDPAYKDRFKIKEDN